MQPSTGKHFQKITSSTEMESTEWQATSPLNNVKFNAYLPKYLLLLIKGDFDWQFIRYVK